MRSPQALETPVQYIKGIGPKRAAALKSIGIHTVRDLLYYFPRDYLDLSRVEKIGNLKRLVNSDQFVTVIGTVRTFDIVGRLPRQRFVVILGDETGTVPLIFFQSIRYFKTAFSTGETLAVSGRVSLYQNRPQLVHPSIDRLMSGGENDDDEAEFAGFLHTKGIVPKYSSSELLRKVGLDTKGFRRVLKAALDQFLGAVDEFQPETILHKRDLIGLQQALHQIHFPESDEHLERARHRLKFDELFFLELLLAMRRKHANTATPGIAFVVESRLARQLVDSLSFKLTRAQVRVINEIAEDMRSAKPMNRLLQGDVGSGKTVVAMIAMLIAVDNGFQAAFMAPTEILAEQHYRTLKTLLRSLPVNIRLLIGDQRKRLREDVLEDVRRGSAQVVVGTHALIQEQVDFAKLGVVVIDEQHRFGVAQRLALREKGVRSQSRTVHPDVLVMTATPIPRTLSLTLYGDLDVSIIDELPSNRKPIKTLLKYESQRDAVFKFVREEVARGRQSYIVYPLVEESEKVDLKAAVESYEHLRQEVFRDLQVGLLHGRMPPHEKDAVMEAFTNKKLHILVATTVVEVGVDVANATVMVIEHAERFGLSQLHQLRGRVGRGSEQSYCVLVAPDWTARFNRTQPTYGENHEVEERHKAVLRLKTILHSTDGFEIAEVDLRLRGPGDFFGTRQSGFPELHIANLLDDGNILSTARREAFEIIDQDPQLRHPQNVPLREHFEEHYRQHLALLSAP